MSEEVGPNIRLLKAVVIILGLLIVIFTGIIVVTIIKRAGEGDQAADQAVQLAQPGGQATVPGATVTGAPVPALPLQGFERSRLSLPKGARIQRMEVGAGRLVLQVELPDGKSQIHLVNLATGESLGVLEIVEED